MSQIALIEDARPPAERLRSAWRDPAEELTFAELAGRCGGVAIALPLSEAMKRGEVIWLHNPTRYRRAP